MLSQSLPCEVCYELLLPALQVFASNFANLIALCLNDAVAPLQDCLEPSLDHTKSTHMSLWMCTTFGWDLSCSFAACFVELLLLCFFEICFFLNALYIYILLYISLPPVLHCSGFICMPSWLTLMFAFVLESLLEVQLGLWHRLSRYKAIFNNHAISMHKTYISMHFLDLSLIYMLILLMLLFVVVSIRRDVTCNTSSRLNHFLLQRALPDVPFCSSCSLHLCTTPHSFVILKSHLLLDLLFHL